VAISESGKKKVRDKGVNRERKSKHKTGGRRGEIEQ
jgi:hypothetical protein